MLPAELSKELKNVAIDQDVKGDKYSILFLTGPPDDATEPYIRVYTKATLSAVQEYQTEPNKLFQAASTEDVRLPDGTQGQLRYMIPEGEVVNYGPYWEGTFHKGEYIYTLSVFLGRDGKSVAKQALSTMVPVEER